MEWNNGTVFRVFINSGSQVEIDAKVDIAQQELNNNCFIGIENYVLKPNTFDPDGGVIPPTQGSKCAVLQTIWNEAKYVQLESVQLPPYIDYSSQNIPPRAASTSPLDNQGGSSITENDILQNTKNTTIFARLPLIATATPGNAELTTTTTFAGDRVLNKDSVLYDMRNNPMALSNGRLRIRLLDETGLPLTVDRYPKLLETLPGSPPVESLINSFAFTLVIYKASERYN